MSDTVKHESGPEHDSESPRQEADREAAPPPEPARRRYRHAIEILATVALALSMAFAVEALAVKPYRIPSQSMEPTLQKGQRILVNRLEKRFGSFGVGDIVVFNPPEGAGGNPSCGVQPPRGAACPRAIDRKSSTTFVKRIVAGPGDRLRLVDGHVIRNGRRASEPFIRGCGADPLHECDRPTEITIPKGHYFMMGDNRGNSLDSRYWGAIPRSWIIGQAFVTYWPPSRLGTL